MQIKTVGVIGAGLMGSGIIEQVARSGYDVIAREINEQAVDGARTRVDSSMRRGLDRGKISQEEYNVATKRITWTTLLNDLADCDLVVEAVIENLDMKKDLFRELSDITRPEALLTSNTSSVSITSLAAVTNRPEKVAGMHFFNPVPVMKLVEIVRALQTSDETVQTLRDFSQTLGKTVVIAKDTPGFIVNFLLIPYLLDAIRMVEDSVASKEDIDTAMTLGTGVPMGPLTLADFIGLDTTLFIANVLYDAFKEHKYAAPPLLTQMVEAGYLGRKTGRGFFDYNKGK